MNKAVIFFSSLVLLFCITAFQKIYSELSYIPQGWPAPVYNFRKNSPDEKKIRLGRLLFYDPILSKDNTISCSSCHSQYNAFAHADHALSHGIEGKIGTRNAPALMNLAWSENFMWDGSVNHLDMQALAPISNAIEMNENIGDVILKLQKTSHYSKLFYEAYGDSGITGEHVLKAFSQFLITLVSANSRYDKVMRNETQFTAQEKNGYILFQKNCQSCHTEPLFTNHKFENNGLAVDDSLRDIGRMNVTGKPEDSLKFKVPTLRNIEFSFPYMHDGRFKTLNQVINNYTRNIRHSPTLNAKLAKGIVLSAEEKTDLISFLLTLSDKDFLFDPRFSYLKE